LFLAQRLERIKQLLYEHKTIDVTSLSKSLDVSEVTIRKDLDRLEKMGFLKKYRGGAILEEDQLGGLNEHEIEDLDLKEECVEPAVQMVEENDKIFISSGSTCGIFARRLRVRVLSNINVITNSFDVAHELFGHVRSIYFLGGEVHQKDSSLYSVINFEGDILKSLYVNKAFISVDGVDLKAGYTVNDMGVVSLYRQIKSVASKIIILADSMKFDKIGMHHIADLSFAHYIATDKRIHDHYKVYFFEKNVKLLTEYSL